MKMMMPTRKIRKSRPSRRGVSRNGRYDYLGEIVIGRPSRRGVSRNVIAFYFGTQSQKGRPSRRGVSRNRYHVPRKSLLPEVAPPAGA